MRCENARERFSPWLDGELAPIEREAMRLHLDSCPECRAEVEAWQAISASLKGISQGYTAPAGFSASVLAQLQAPSRQKPRISFQKWAASAAAALILVGSSAGLALHYRGDSTPPAVVVIDPVNTATTADPIPTVVPGTSGQGTTTPDNTGPVIPDNQPTTPDNPAVNPDSVVTPPAPTQPFTVVEVVRPKTFLSTEKVITTTLLKLRVPDPTAAFKLADSLGKTYSASMQVLGQQAGEKYVIKFVVPVEKEAGLMQGLRQLGTIRDQATDKQDVTDAFAQTLESYRDAVSQLNAATDENQREELSARVKHLENLLSNWDKESGKRVIVLWLES